VSECGQKKGSLQLFLKKVACPLYFFLDYKATESWLFSFIKLIWGIFILVRLRKLAVKKSYKLFEKHLNIPLDNFGMFNAINIRSGY